MAATTPLLRSNFTGRGSRITAPQPDADDDERDHSGALISKRSQALVGLQGSVVEMSVIDINGIGFDEFLNHVEEIERDFNKVSEILKNLQDANEKSKVAIKVSKMKDIQKDMEKDVEKVKNIALTAKSKLDDLDEDNLKNRSKPGCLKGSSIDRFRMTTTIALRKKWKHKVCEFQALRQNIKEEYRDIVGRTVFTATGNHVDKEVIDQLLEMGVSGQIYQKVILDQGRGEIIDTLADIENRHETVTEIEKQLLELQQIFLDMSLVVGVQGEMLDNIESQVHSAIEHVQAGTDSLRGMRTMKQNSRKWFRMAILLFFLLAVIIIIVVVAVKVKPWKGL